MIVVFLSGIILSYLYYACSYSRLLYLCISLYYSSLCVVWCCEILVMIRKMPINKGF